MIDLRAIQHAWAVAKLGSFKEAAESLSLTQPTLSRSIHSLEESLEVKLFDQEKKKIVPTILGRIFLAKAEEVMKAASELKREVDLARGLEIGNFKIGVGAVAAELLIGKALGYLSQRYPHLYMQITVDDFAALTNLLLAGQIELFVAETSELKKASDFLVTPLHVLKFYFFCRGGHPLLDRLPNLTLRECLEHPFVMTKLPRRVIESIAETCKLKKYSNDLRELPIIKCDYVVMIKALVAHSNAIALLLLPMIEQELKSGQFVLLPCDFPEQKTNLGIVQLWGRPLSPPAEVFINLLRELDAEVARKDQELRETLFPRLG